MTHGLEILGHQVWDCVQCLSPSPSATMEVNKKLKDYGWTTWYSSNQIVDVIPSVSQENIWAENHSALYGLGELVLNSLGTHQSKGSTVLRT